MYPEEESSSKKRLKHLISMLPDMCAWMLEHPQAVFPIACFDKELFGYMP